MPFDYEAYNEKCSSMTVPQLQLEWENYTRQLAGGATSTGCAVLFSPVTAGVSLVGLGVSAPRVQNARKKRDIVERYLVAQGATHTTRKRDVALPAAISGTLGGLTLGLAGPGADLLGGVAAEKGAEYIISHAALEGAGAALEHGHTTHEKDKAFEKRGGTPVPVQEQQYEAVPVPPSYSSSQHLPLPTYQPPQQTVQLASTPGTPIVSPSTHGHQSPHTQQETSQQPEKILYVVGNPASEQPFGLQFQEYPPEKTPAWAPLQDSNPQVPANHSHVKAEIHTGSPMVQQEAQATNIQSAASSSSSTLQQSTPLISYTPPPWSYDFNQWDPPPHGAQELAASAVDHNRTQVPIVNQSLVPQPLFISAPRTSSQDIIVPQPSQPVQPSQEPSVQSPESSRPDPTPLQSVVATETPSHASLAAQPSTPIQPHDEQPVTQLQQQQSGISASLHSNSPERYGSQQAQSIPPPPPPRTPVTEQQSYPSGDSQQQHQMGYPETASLVSAFSTVSLQSPISPLSPQVVVQPPQHHYHSHSQLPASSIQPHYQPSQTPQQTPPPLLYQSGPQYPQVQQYHPTLQPQQNQPLSSRPQYQPQAQTQYQYNPSTYVPNPSPVAQQQQNHFFALQPTSLHPGSIPQPANTKPTRPVSMLSSLGSTLATSLSSFGSSRPSSPNPAQQQQQQGYGAPPTPGSWTGPPSAISPPPGYASPLSVGLSASPGGHYPLVSPPPAYASPVNGSMVSAGKDYFGRGAVSQGQGPPVLTQMQQIGVPASGKSQQYYAVPPPVGQWGQ